MSRRPDDARHAPPDRTRDLAARDIKSWTPSNSLSLPRSDERQRVIARGRAYRLRNSETELLATVGAFRVVPEHATQRDASERQADVRALSEQGLLERHTVVINRRPETVLVLSKAGKAILDEHRDHPSHGRTQEYHAGLVKPRELAHDAQLHRLFQTEARRIEAEGGRVTRVVLDYEWKRDYHAFVHRTTSTNADVDARTARRMFAEQHDLPFGAGRIQFPDVRIEYESEDGRECHRDLELSTEHYSRSQVAGKQRAGFRVYRAVNAGGASGRGTPADPHHLEWLT